MKIATYKNLILILPVREQCFTTKRATWKKAEESFDWFKKINDKLFEGNDTLTVSRQDVFDTYYLREKIVKAIFWGYTYGMRGNNLENILKKIENIERIIEHLKKVECPNASDFENMRKSFLRIKGIGISTYTKLLYFNKISFEQSPCLVLDSRLIDVFSRNFYSEFLELKNMRYDNAESKYLQYIHLMNKVSKELKTNPENVELFLFTFGNNLKERPINKNIVPNDWNGYCPESWLKGKTVRMRLNQYDFFKSEETELQICVIPNVQAVILKFRGQGKFRSTATYGDQFENGELLSPQNIDKPPFNNSGEIFNSSEEIEKYISEINQ